MPLKLRINDGNSGFIKAYDENLYKSIASYTNTVNIIHVMLMCTAMIIITRICTRKFHILYIIYIHTYIYIYMLLCEIPRSDS